MIVLATCMETEKGLPFLAPRSFPGGADPSGANLFRSASIFGFWGPREGVDGGLQG